MTLYEKLSGYAQSDYYGFHMPGHKRNKMIMEEEFPFHIDITEIVIRRILWSIKYEKTLS